MKLFLAAFEASKKHLDALLLDKPLFVLGSFYYLKKLKIQELDKYMQYIKQKSKDFILDSGAFTFLNKGKIENLEDYVNEYIDFINKYDIKNFIELDIDSIVGYEKVLEIRKLIEEKTGKKCIPAFHLSRGIEEYKKLTKEYDYIAIGGIVTKEIKAKDCNKIFPKLLRIAQKNNCKVHGLGFTVSNVQKYNFYSVDSTSWLSGNKYGRMSIFKNTKLRTIIMSKDKKINIKGNNYEKVLSLSLKEWVKYQKYLERIEK